MGAFLAALEIHQLHSKYFKKSRIILPKYKEGKGTKSILAKFWRFDRTCFVVGTDKSSFMVMKRKTKSKIINFVLTFGSAFVIFMVFMVIAKFM